MTASLRDIDLGFLVEREVLQVAVGVFQTIVHFDCEILLTIEAECELSGVACAIGVEAGARLLSTIGRTIKSAVAIQDHALELTFDDETILRVVAPRDEDGESFTITAPGITIAV